MYVYKITNKENGKIYIGQSIKPIEQRFKRHINDAMSGRLDTHFARAIRKYGEEAFYIELIDMASTQEELTYKEWSWIRYYNSDIVGYNETDNMNKCGGNTYQDKSKEEMKEICRKIRESKLGKNNPHSTPIKCLNVNTNEELFFWTQEDCTKYFGEDSHSFISRRLNHKTDCLYKGEWNFAYLHGSYRYLSPTPNCRKGNKIYILNCRMFSETIYNSMEKASQESGIPINIFKDNSRNGILEFFYNGYRIKIEKDR